MANIKIVTLSEEYTITIPDAVYDRIIIDFEEAKRTYYSMDDYNIDECIAYVNRIRTKICAYIVTLLDLEIITGYECDSLKEHYLSLITVAYEVALEKL